jgi:hypothetical protein
MIVPALALPQTDSLDDLRAALAGGLRLDFGQGWLAAPQPELRPAHARLGWDPAQKALGVLVELADDDIYTDAKPGIENQRLWRFGDVVELFLRKAGSPAYHEFHVAPGGQILRVRFPSRKAFVNYARKPVRDELLDPLMLSALPGERLLSWVGDGVWHAFFQIPLAALSARPPGVEWQVNVARYDYTRGQEDPVLSATAPLAIRQFHERQYWTTVQLSG